MDIGITGALQSLLNLLEGNETLQTTALLLIGVTVLICSKGVRDKLLQLDQALTSLLRRVLHPSSKTFKASLPAESAGTKDLQRIEVEAKSRIAQAEGEAKVISVQSQAIQSGGGANYVQLQAIQKWDGKLPTTTTTAIPFLSLK